MKWRDVMGAVISTVEDDEGIDAIYGDEIRLGGSPDFAVPSLQYHLVADGETELFSTVVLQFDQWCATLADLTASELRLTRLFHRDLPENFAGLVMWAQYVDGESLAVPDRDGYFARAVRFRFTPLRDLYQPSPTP
jgi:hypothetical protein